MSSTYAYQSLVVSSLAVVNEKITELPNKLTTDIDKCDSLGIVHLLRQSDAQLFAGWDSHDSICDTIFLRKIDKLASKTASFLLENENAQCKNMIVLTGCGTSGRIAWSCSCSFNRLLCRQQKNPCYQYLIAGGDKALIVGDELPEDDPLRGARDLADLTGDADRVMLIGITCGLSAPYVAGQVDYSMEKENFYSVLIGFNPVGAARDVNIEKWKRTCKDVFSKLEQLELTSDKGMVITPAVGPEPITGSSRMKGGSMTAIILDTIFLLAFSRAFSVPLTGLLNIPASLVPSDSKVPIPDLGSNGRDSHVGVGGDKTVHILERGESEVGMVIDAFSSTYNAAYRPASGLATLIDAAGASLRHPEGHLYYLGARLFGVVGFIDSSEMVSTFGSSPHEVRGFVEGGWTACQNRTGDLSEEGELFRISFADFERDVFPTLSKHDCVLWLHGLDRNNSSPTNRNKDNLKEKILSSQALCCLVSLAGYHEEEGKMEASDLRFRCQVLVSCPHFGVGEEPLFAAFALKLILNAVSTGANILRGRVYHNMMVNLKVANDKLFYRSLDIVSQLGKVSKEKARAALLRAIYRQDDGAKHSHLPVSEHIKKAVRQNMVVPMALVLASKDCSLSEAEKVIADATAIRNAIETIGVTE